MVGFTLSPDHPVTGDTLVTAITVEPADADDDELSFVYRWYRDEELQEDLTESSVLPASTAKGEIWRVEVSAFDGRDEGPPTQAERSIGNTPPELLSLGTQPSEPRSDEDITVVYEATDADDDPLDVQVQWILNTTIRSSEETLSAVHTTRGEIWLVEATLLDGGGVEPTGSHEVTIENALPAGAISIDPESPTTIDSLTAIVEGTDNDGDSISWTLAWFIDGIEHGSNSTLSWTTTSRGQEIVAQGLPFDGFEEGEMVSSEPADQFVPRMKAALN